MIIELKTLDQIDPCQLAYHANEKSIGMYLRNTFPYPYTLDHAMSFITHSLQNHGLDFGIVVDGICVGCIGGTLHNDIYVHNCELGYWLNPLYAHRGIMQQAVRLFCQHVFECYHIHKIYAEVFVENKASCRVLEWNHFEKEGYLFEHAYKNFQYHDVIIYSLRRTTWK